MRIKIFAALALLALAALPALACPQFAAGNAAYQAADYEGALVAYKSCLEPDGRTNSASLAYNLGNAYFRLDSLGKAILFYEKARRLAPADEAILHNLQFAQARTQDKAETPDNPLLRILYKIHHALSLDTQLLVFVGISWMIAVLLALLFLKKPRTALRDILFLCVFLLALAGGVGVLSAAGKVWQLEGVEWGVVTGRTADVHSGPGKQYPVLNELSEGATVEVLSQQGEGGNRWAQVRFGSAVEGFVPLSQMGIVD
jgi:tetratricopeptide (TPR) repeat protein